jgi:hypothetical protein
MLCDDLLPADKKKINLVNLLNEKVEEEVYRIKVKRTINFVILVAIIYLINVIRKRNNIRIKINKNVY